MFNYGLFAGFPHYSQGNIEFNSRASQNPPQPDTQTSEEYRKLKDKYEKLKRKYSQSKDENRRLKEYVAELELILQPDMERKKVRRRMQNELDKQHSCPYHGCRKQYASPIALNLHIRSKHDGGSKKERVAYLKARIEAQEKGESLPATSLNLPPEVIEYQRNCLLKKASVRDISSRVSLEASEEKDERFSSPQVKQEPNDPQRSL